MKRCTWVALLLAFTFAFSGVVAAGYHREGDWSISLLPELGTGAGFVANLGSMAFDLQEGLHTVVTDTTGIEIEHSYIWLGIGGQYVPIDPIYVYGD